MKNLPNAEEFIGYIGGPQLHDAMIVRVDDLGEEVRVIIKAHDGGTFTVSFSGVRSTSSNKPEGMTLYAVAELSNEPGQRRFVFLNWDENDAANLEIVAAEYSVES